MPPPLHRPRDPAPVADIASLPNRLTRVSAHNLVGISDMRGTLADPGSIQDNPVLDPLRETLRKIKAFAVLTGDTPDTVATALAVPIADTSASFYSVTGFGYQLHQFVGTKSTLLTSGAIFPRLVRRTAAELILGAAAKTCSDPAVLGVDELRAIETDVAFSMLNQLSTLGGPLPVVFEIAPNKISVYFPTCTKGGLPPEAITFLDSLKLHYEADPILLGTGVRPLRGSFYLDFCLATKADGLRLLQTLAEFQLGTADLVLLGDSINDRELLLGEFRGTGRRFRILVGIEDDLAAEIYARFSGELIYLRGEYLGGTAAVFRVINSNTPAEKE